MPGQADKLKFLLSQNEMFMVTVICPLLFMLCHYSLSDSNYCELGSVNVLFL